MGTTETQETLITVKLFTKTLVQLRELKKQLKLNGIKETVQYIMDVYNDKVELPANIHQDVREQQNHILELCKQIKASIDTDIQKRNGFNVKQTILDAIQDVQKTQDDGDDYELV